ncbi:MAG: fumarylacetoacetate hydrolase family protein [Pseudomonadota bacterium]
MKLFRHGPKGSEKPGIFVDGKHRDLGDLVPDFERSGVGFEALEALQNIDMNSLPEISDGTRLGPCLASAPNIFCIGLNYAKHAAETGATLPENPVMFMKATSSLNGPFDPISLPTTAEKADWEVELGLVIGNPGYRIHEADALSYVAGYFTANDISERNWQKLIGGGQWPKGKSGPGFCPIGPYLVTADEVPDPNDLSLMSKRNGALMQNSNTSDMIFTVPQIISHLSQFLEFQPGDIILTGTPEGVGLGMTPPQFLQPGDVLETEVQGLGAMKNNIIAL